MEPDLANQLGRIEAELRAIDSKIDSTKDDLEKDIQAVDSKLSQYTHLFQFTPVQRLVYGLVGLVLIGVVTAILGYILTQPGATSVVP